MRKVLLFPAMLLVSSGLAAQSTPPDKAAGIAAIETSIKGKLRDPDSAKFTWPFGFTWGTYKRAFVGKATGWITCGTVNAKNGFGGYVGAKTVIGVLVNGSVALADIDDNENFGANHGPPTDACRNLGMPTF